MIIGIGQDLTDIKRIAGILEGKLGDRFLRRILAEKELETALSYEGVRLHQYVAGRFAAKEAVAKAFGCGLGSQLWFTDIGVGRDCSGKPVCELSSEAWGRLRLSREETSIHITISHERELASAFAVVERIKL
ncbi:holo-ACP synthase [Paenibacillus sp. GCM10027627]|uniref:holo-ACP synthase n=1 Tax=unclassified Paenibacillus TaxID=185978 RepID=UPI00362A9B5D